MKNKTTHKWHTTHVTYGLDSYSYSRACSTQMMDQWNVFATWTGQMKPTQTLPYAIHGGGGQQATTVNCCKAFTADGCNRATF